MGAVRTIKLSVKGHVSSSKCKAITRGQGPASKKKTGAAHQKATAVKVRSPDRRSPAGPRSDKFNAKGAPVESARSSPVRKSPQRKSPQRKSPKRSSTRSSASASPAKRVVGPAAAAAAADGGSNVADDSVDGAVSEAQSLHNALLDIFKSNYRCKGGSWNNGAVAVGVAAGEMYWDLLGVFNRLFPQAQLGIRTEETLQDETKYSVFEIQGEDFEGRKGRKKFDMGDKLEQLRSRGPVGRATEALFTVLSCMGSRKEMCWIESFEDEKPNRGYFPHALVESMYTTRLSCVDLGNRVVPASLILTEQWDFRDCLENFDNDGPLKEAPKRLTSKFEFAFQALIDSDKLGSEDERINDVRVPQRDLTVDQKLTELILKDAPVMLIDSFLALAPREVVTSEGLSKVIRNEFETVLRKAKQDGIPVILQLGGSEAHMLAKKVYMRPNFAQFGLRCGYIRWRSGPGANWGKEQHSDDRVCLGLQLP